MAINLHLYDDIWLAEQLTANWGTYLRTWDTVGGRAQKGNGQHAGLIGLLYAAILAGKRNQIIVIAKILENVYGVSRTELPRMLIEHEQTLSLA